MTRVAEVLVGGLVIAVAGLGYVVFTLYEENERQSSSIEELSDQARAVEEVRSDVMAQVEDALGEGAAAYLSAAQRVEGKIGEIESDIDDMQGFGWTTMGPNLTDLQAQVDELWGPSGTCRIARRASASCYATWGPSSPADVEGTRPVPVEILTRPACS